MLIPPAHFKGWKVTTVGDDIAWMKIGDDGRLYAINPENGYFGVVPGTNYKSNPNAMKSIEHDTLYTNVALTDDGDVWWEGKDGPPPAHAIDWKGNDWTPDSKEKAAHPNSRFAAPMRNNPVLDPDVEDGEGVPISAIIFGGRRSDTMPLVFQALRLGTRRLHRRDHGFGNHRRRDRRGRPGAARSDGDAAVLRLQHGRLFPALARDRPAPEESAAHFPRELVPQRARTENFSGPALATTCACLKWMIDRCEGRGGAEQSPIGWIPRPEDLDLDELGGVSPETNGELFSIKPNEWKNRAGGAEEFFETLRPDMPQELHRATR